MGSVAEEFISILKRELLHTERKGSWQKRSRRSGAEGLLEPQQPSNFDATMHSMFGRVRKVLAGRLPLIQARATVRAREQRVEQLKRRAKQLKRRVGSLKRRAERLKHQVGSLKRQVRRLKHRVRKLEAKLERLKPARAESI